MESQVLRVIQGTDRNLKVLLKNGNGSAFDLSDVDTIKAFFKKEGDQEQLLEVNNGGGGAITIVGDPARGEIQIALSDTNTTAMRAGSRLSWEIEIKINALTYVTQFPEALDVIARLTAT